MNPLKEFREEAMMTVRELSERSGVSEDTITKIENGHRKGRGMTLRKLARALGVGLQELSPEHFERTTDAEADASGILPQHGTISFEVSRENSPVSRALQDAHTLDEAILRVYEVMRAIDQSVEQTRFQERDPDTVPRPIISERQQKVLITVLWWGPVSPSTVADRLGISVSTAYEDLLLLGEEHSLVFRDESGKWLISPLGEDLVEAIIDAGSELSLDEALSQILTLMRVYDSVAEFDPHRATDEDAASFFRLQELIIRSIRRIAALTEPPRLAYQVQQGGADEPRQTSVRRSDAPVSQDEPEDDTIIDLQADDGVQIIEGLEDRLLLQEAINGFKGVTQHMLRLHFNEGKSQTEIADHIGLDQEQVSGLLRRAIEDLRVELERLESDRATGRHRGAATDLGRRSDA